MLAYGHLTKSDLTTDFYIGPTATLVTGWTAGATRQDGDLSVTQNTTDSRLTLAAGIYLVVGHLQMEGEAVGGTSGDATGFVTGAIYQGGTVVAGSKDKADIVVDGTPDSVTCHAIVEITAAQVTAGTNYVDLRLTAADGSGNDVDITNGRLIAVKIAG